MGAIVWLSQTGQQLINSGSVGGAESASAEALQQMMTDLGWVYVTIAAGWVMYGSASQGSAYPSHVTYIFPDGTAYELSFAWSCSWNQDPGGGYPPGV